MDLYQSLVTVNPVTLIAQICNLFLQMFLVKVFFLDKIKAILDARREAADKEITDAKTAKEEAMVIKATYEQNMLESKAKAEKILQSAQQTATQRGEQIISDAQKTAVAMKQKAEAEIALEKKRAINDVKNQVSGLAVDIAAAVIGRDVSSAEHEDLINDFIENMGEK
jgi:F-type H+-transporting ATPase subunit b